MVAEGKRVAETGGEEGGVTDCPPRRVKSVAHGLKAVIVCIDYGFDRLMSKEA